MDALLMAMSALILAVAGDITVRFLQKLRAFATRLPELEKKTLAHSLSRN